MGRHEEVKEEVKEEIKEGITEGTKEEGRKAIRERLKEEQIQELIRQAVLAREKAYAPYSDYRVGAAVYVESGKIYTGCNIENASYGATVCAERVAIFKAVSEGEKKLLGLALVCDDTRRISPCGICRQVKAEFGLDMPLYMRLLDGSNEWQQWKNSCHPSVFGERILKDVRKDIW